MMSLQRRNRRKKIISQINVVPYIDITLALLVIFMMTAPMQQSTVEVNLPVTRAVKTKVIAQPPLVITIQKDGQYFLSEKENTEQNVLFVELLSRVARVYKNNPQIQVYIKADTAVNYGKVISVMAALKEAGVPQVGLMTSSSEP
jgi:biopolymer transport protein TolR